MAKRKKHHTTKRRAPRRRIGAMSGSAKNDLEEVLGLILASVGGTVIQRMVPATVSPKIVAAGQLAAGYYFHKSPHPVMRGVGWGLLGTGAISLTHDLGIIHGLDDLVSGIMGGGEYMEMPQRVKGFSNDSYMSGAISNSGRIGDMEEPSRDYMEPIGSYRMGSIG